MQPCGCCTDLRPPPRPWQLLFLGRRTQLKRKAQKKSGQGAGAQGVTMCSAHHARCSRVRVSKDPELRCLLHAALSRSECCSAGCLLVLGADAKRAAPLSLALNSTHNLDARRRNKEESGAPYYKFWQQSVALSSSLSRGWQGKEGYKRRARRGPCPLCVHLSLSYFRGERQAPLRDPLIFFCERLFKMQSQNKISRVSRALSHSIFIRFY